MVEEAELVDVGHHQEAELHARILRRSAAG
jgi:hypothetical protein